MTKTCISVIVPTYNRAEMLRGALESLVRQETSDKFEYELVIVDNASTDATRAVVEEAAANATVPVRYFYESKPGPAPARNCGLANARGNWIAFFDDDELPTPNWLAQLYSAAVETDSAIIGGAMHLDLPEEVLKRLNRFVRTTSLREIDYYPTIQPYDGKRLPGTNNALVARHVFDAVGTFDGARVMAGSDSDFFLRARAAGFPLIYTPHAIVRHRVAPNRLTTEYFRWDAQQGSIAFAGLDCKYKGRAKLTLLCLARVAHAALVVTPRLAWGIVTRDPAEVLGQRVRLWRAEGYARRTISLLAPRVFPQNGYFADLEFRHGRIVGQPCATSAATSKLSTI